MALKYADRVAESTVSTGLGDIFLAGPIDADHDIFGAQFIDGDLLPVSVFGGGKWMTFIGRYNSGANSLTRLTFRRSSTGANLVLSGTMTVLCGWGAADAAAMIRADEAQALTAAQQEQSRANIGVGRNRIDNGAMRISQLNGATGSGADNYKVVDKFLILRSHGGVHAAQQVASPTPGGSTHRIRVTVTTADTSVGASDYLAIQTKIEGCDVADLRFGSAASKPCVLSIGCNAPAGTYSASFRNALLNRAYVGEIVIGAGEANTDVIKSVLFTPDTTGTWANAIGAVGLEILIVLMGGSNFQKAPNAWGADSKFASTNQSNFMSAVNNVFELFDVGFDKGNAARQFELVSLADDLRRCHRWQWVTTAPPLVGSAATPNLIGRARCSLPAKMYAAPVITLPDGPLNIAAGNSSPTTATIANSYPHDDSIEVNLSTAGTLTTGHGATVFDGPNRLVATADM